MTNATAVAPTNAQLQAVYDLNKAMNDLEKTLPSFLSDDEASDLVSNAIYSLNLSLNEDEDNAHEAFWTLCEKRGIA